MTAAEWSVQTGRSKGGWIRRAVLSRLERLEGGRLVLRDAHGEYGFGEASGADTLQVTMEVHDDALWRDVALRGVLGAGEAYAAGRWTTNDLVAAVRLFLRNRSILEALDGGWSRLSRPLLAAWHRLRSNTRAGSRRNIVAHYDLGNEFFQLFLDETMTYSSGIFPSEDADLRTASLTKYDRLIGKLGIESHHHVLEIGCGWGGFAVRAAGRTGCRVTAVTLSPSQASYAREVVGRLGLEDRVTILEQDYRDVEGVFDRLVSIEMIEAVGHDHLDEWVQVLSDRLAPDGRVAIQAITIADQHYERARRNVDFIKRHVFPGTFIPSVAAITGAVSRAGDLRLVHLEDIGPHYATTLARWRERFHANADAVRQQGFPESFARGWDYYLGYCEAGFRERFLGTAQMVLAKPADRNAPLLATFD